jgi:hypothetical protein
MSATNVSVDQLSYGDARNIGVDDFGGTEFSMALLKE